MILHKPPLSSYLLLVGLLVLPLLSLFARDVEITVTDGDLEIPLEGALIRSWDGEEYICDEAGRALVRAPDDRQVVIQIAYPGYENRRFPIPPEEDRFTVELRLGGIMESRELVIEAERPGTSETQSGRSVAISGEALTRTAEIGIIEDVMHSIKLLPGVGYSGMFNALPSIRGGDPGDLTAVLDGYYVQYPYHWGGGFSIFDPRMVSSARLSHGVFSARYGHTISGLLEVSSKKPSATETTVDLGLSTSATELALSYPLGGRGGILAMGRVTYWDPLVEAAKLLAKKVESISMINAVQQAPYIRSVALAGNYRFGPNLELTGNGFFGADGVSVVYNNDYDPADFEREGFMGRVDMSADYHNYQGFLITGLTFNPLPVMVLKTTIGTGYQEALGDAGILNELTVRYNEDFAARYITDPEKTSYRVNNEYLIKSDNKITYAQGRADLDWDLGKGFLFAGGFQELYSRWNQDENVYLLMEIPLSRLPSEILTFMPWLEEASWSSHPDAALYRPLNYQVPVENSGFTSSAYALTEYKSPRQRFGAELGLRLDHLYFIGKDFTIQTYPAFNPRLNLDFNILRDYGPIDSLSATAGTGLFSSMNDTISFIEKRNGIDDFEMTPNRSWTSVIGTKVDFAGGFSFNIEGYFKYVFDRAYVAADPAGMDSLDVNYAFDGEGRIWGFDLQLQKFASRYWDGWLAYTFTYARYHDPSGGVMGVNMGGIDGNETRWYYPSFHRFHYLNLVMNIKPLRQFNIGLRLGLASGRPKNKVGDELALYPVQQVDEQGQPVGDLIQQYRRSSWYDDNERTSWSIPLDLKFSWYRFNPRGKVQTEIYLGAENLLSLFYTARGNTRFNSYTGKEDTGTYSASYELPIPMISFGFNWSY
ncbi:MAG: TonB-dependent receptor plug domain-containing protein [Spirochaetaceae bacterium]|jgi:hypothetical protein|nr:TonB-dependent receptor plug domain-containing protein [Spirochaetaceae bacterium]